MKAIARSIRITPKKINLIAELIRNKEVTEAMNILKYTPKKGAKILAKVLKSAVSNAETNFKQEKSHLFVKEIVVNKAFTLKRSVPISRGRMHPILKRNAHVSLTVGVLEGKVTAKKKATKAAAPKAEKTESEKTTPVKSTKAKKTTSKKTTTKSNS
jgi:large subunit ribosomal protein L22